MSLFFWLRLKDRAAAAFRPPVPAVCFAEKKNSSTLWVLLPEALYSSCAFSRILSAAISMPSFPSSRSLPTRLMVAVEAEVASEMV